MAPSILGGRFDLQGLALREFSYILPSYYVPPYEVVIGSKSAMPRIEGTTKEKENLLRLTHTPL